MKLKRTREEWESYRALHSKQDCAALYHHAVADLLALSAEVDRLTAQLAERDRLLANWEATPEQMAEMGNLDGILSRGQIRPEEYIREILKLTRFHAAEDKSHDA